MTGCVAYARSGGGAVWLLRTLFFAVGLTLIHAPAGGHERKADPGEIEDRDAPNSPENPYFSKLEALHPKNIFRAGLWTTRPGDPPETAKLREITAFFDGQPSVSPRPFRILATGQRLSGKPYDFWFQQPPDKTVAFTSFDAASRSLYASAGFKRAIRGHLDEPGFRFMATFGLKMREYDPALGIARSRLHAARMLVGYEWKIASLSVTAMAGTSFVLNTTEAIQTTHRLGRIGPVGMVELWQDWGKHGVLGSRFTSLFASADQASRSFYLRLRHGFALGNTSMRIGPEISASTGESQFRRGTRLQDGWRKARLGAQLSEIPLWQARLGVSAGVEWRENGHPGGYVQLGGYIRY